MGLVDVSKRSTVERFKALFTGLDTAYGKWHKNAAQTIRKEPTLNVYKAHLEGKVGLGIVPIMSNSTCLWGAVDIDNKGRKESVEIDHEGLAKEIKEKGLPLIVTRSKSGGCHLYTFLSKPMKARQLRKMLNDWAATLGYGAEEIFPKQDESTDVGNWINLPYFNAEETNRYAVTENGPMSFEEFLDEAESMRAEDSDLGDVHGVYSGRTSDVPPCIRPYLTDMIPEGARNEILFNFGIFYKMSSPATWEEQIFETNYKSMDRPLPREEVNRLITSLKRKEYFYRCDSDVCQENCNKLACQELEWGIGEDDDSYGEFLVGLLRKVHTDPVTWILDINGVDIEFTTAEIMSYRAVRIACMERADFIAPNMKDEKWLRSLNERLRNKQDIEAPDDASRFGMIWHMLLEFLQGHERARSREDLQRGLPVRETISVIEDEFTKERTYKDVVLFRSADFLTFMKRKRFNTTIQGKDLWQYLKRRGCGYKSLRYGGTVRKVWHLPFELIESDNNLPLKEDENSDI